MTKDDFWRILKDEGFTEEATQKFWDSPRNPLLNGGDMEEWILRQAAKITRARIFGDN